MEAIGTDNSIKASRRTLLRLSIFGIVLFGVVCGFWLQSFLQNRRLQSTLAAEYRRTLSELTVSAVSLEESLTLLRYAASPQQTALHAAGANRKASDTVYLLGRLPFSSAETEGVTAAFARIESYAVSLTRQSTAPDFAPYQNDDDILQRLVQAVRLCSEVFAEWEQTVLDGDITSFFAPNPSENGESFAFAAQGLQRMATELAKLPDLDFEDESPPPMAAMLNGRPEISEGEALRAALDFAGLEEGQLRFLRRTEGKIPCYSIGGHLDGGEVFIEITCQGGMVLSMMNSRKAEEKTLSLEAAQKNAETFLQSRGYAGMVCCGVTEREDILLLQFVYSQDGVLCYPDRIQIGLAADTGKIVSFESSDYLMHHSPRRDMAPPVLSEEEAVSALHPDLEIESIARCIILSSGQNERFCCEAVVRTEDGQRLAYYIDAGTGETERITTPFLQGVDLVFFNN